MSISEVPGKPRELIGLSMSDFDKGFRGRLDFQQSPIVELQSVPVGHGNRFRKIQKDIFTLVRHQRNASAVAGIEIERDRALSPFLRPIPGKSMN